MPTLLSKTNFLKGIQCPRLLWFSVHEPEKLPEVDEILQHRFDQGHLVGSLAKKLFSSGIEIVRSDLDSDLKKTQELLLKRVPLFEPAIKNDVVYARADILFPVNDSQWDIIEVKSSTSPKEMHIYDLAFQKYCYEQAGLRINKCYVMNINSSYVRHGEINPRQLFTKRDVDELVGGVKIKETIGSMLALIASDKPPTEICADCGGPDNCPLPSCCWDLPEHHVFHLHRGGKKSIELFSMGVFGLHQIPSDFDLSANQNIQKECAKSGKPFIDKAKIKMFIDSLSFPLYFLDFETYNIAIPLYEGTSPYQQIPFQFSLHVLDSFDSVLKHHSFLASGLSDPRESFLLALKEAIGVSGSIVAYNQSFEKRVLNELSEDFPSNKDWIDALNLRFVDLLSPFAKFYYYDPKQKGSASIKNVLPALTGRSYTDLEIAGGESASLQYLYIVNGRLDGKKASPEEVLEIRRNLEKYCCMDTLGMVEILRVLRENV